MKRHWNWTGLVFVLLFVLTACFIVPPSANATPPENVKLRYDNGSKVLSVTITHDNLGKSTHYIKVVEIKKNGTVVSVKTYNSQTQPILFIYQYKINAIEEDMIQAVATCSEGQSKASAVLTIAP